MSPEDAPEESNLEMARRHVREAEEKVASQTAIVHRLQAHGHDTQQAESLLENFKGILHLAREHLAIEEREHGAGDAGTHA